MATIRLSELLAVGVRYLQLDAVSTVFFADGTRLFSRWREWSNGEGSSGEDHDLVCVRDGVCYDVVDDVYAGLRTADRSAVGDLPQRTPDGKKHPRSVWTTRWTE